MQALQYTVEYSSLELKTNKQGICLQLVFYNFYFLILHKNKFSMSSSQLSFVVFILNKYALATQLPITTIYKQFKELHVLDEYLVKHYDVLHTLSENYLIEDLSELIAQKSL